MLRKWKENKDTQTVALLAALFMMNLHSLMEINVSVRPYGICFYVLIAIIAIAYGEPLLLKGKAAIRKAANTAVVLFWVVVAILATTTITNRVVDHVSMNFKTESHAQFMDKLDRYIALDVFTDDYYKTLYVAQHENQPQYQEKVAKYAGQLRKSGTFTNCDAVARYYYMPRGLLDEVFVCSMEGIAQKAADKDAWNGEFEFYRAKVLPTYAGDWANAEDPFVEGVLSVRDYLERYSQGRMEEVELTEENKAFIAAVETVWSNPDMTPEESFVLLSQFSYAESEA